MVEQAIPGLQSEQSSLRLEQIASLRAQGIGDYISLPQLVVCGDQSSGKSSVLEGLTNLPFPRQDGICTRFATEIILENTDNEIELVATIIPASSRIETERIRLQAYSRHLDTLEEIPEVIAEVGSLMGVRGYGEVQKGPTFGSDILRIKATGKTGLHLTIVDLPGLISVPSDDQTEEDVFRVHELVDLYAKNPRTIILAVVQAGNDISNQSIIQKARKFDESGTRTIGIITKPDLINKGTEKRISRLAKNEDTIKLRLGFFIVKNPTPIQLADGIAHRDRLEEEAAFFRSSPWKEQGLSNNRVGTLSLRVYLQALLYQHIERELPKVREEIRSTIVRTRKNLSTLGEERSTPAHSRTHLLRLTMRFHDLVTAALHGYYHESDSNFFGHEEDSQTRHDHSLRAALHILNTEFADYMKINGEKRKIADKDVWDLPPDENLEEGQLLITSEEMRSWVKNIYRDTRGKELPGSHNHTLLSELYHAQSSRWQQITDAHILKVFEKILNFMKEILAHVITEEKVYHELFGILDSSLSNRLEAAKAELEHLYEDEAMQPITYNHYYTDNIQNGRSDTLRALIKKAMTDASVEEYNGKMHVSNTTVDAEKLLASLQRRVVVEMDEQACNEALVALNAYYKVSRKLFVDNVCRQVIERHLVRPLPDIICPEVVTSFSDSDLGRFAMESAENRDRRRECRKLLDMLETAQRMLL